jgi:hypothetical protein
MAFIKKVLTKILGHKSSKTTEIYTHVSSKQIANIKTPFDELEIDLCKLPLFRDHSKIENLFCFKKCLSS